jgi:hypothetical protein
MMNGMDTPKVRVAVTMRPDVLSEVRARVESGQARSVSAFVQHAEPSQLAVEADFDALVAQLLAATGGPVTEAERLAAQSRQPR